MSKHNRGRLDGKVAIITGATRGIGRGIVELFAKEGASVAINYATSKDAAMRLVAALNKRGLNAIAIKGDVTNIGDVESMVNIVLKNFKRVDILVNNASYSVRNSWNLPISDIDEKEWDKVIAVDIKGTFLCSKTVSSIMLKQKRGVIINMASAAAIQGDETCLLYSAAKAGVIGFTRSLAKALAPYVRVNAIAPGSVETDWITKWKVPKSSLREIIDTTPLHRMGKVGDIAALALFLASDESSFITGQTVIIDGGIMMQ